MAPTYLVNLDCVTYTFLRSQIAKRRAQTTAQTTNRTSSPRFRRKPKEKPHPLYPSPPVPPKDSFCKSITSNNPFIVNKCPCQFRFQHEHNLAYPRYSIPIPSHIRIHDDWPSSSTHSSSSASLPFPLSPRLAAPYPIFRRLGMTSSPELPDD